MALKLPPLLVIVVVVAGLVAMAGLGLRLWGRRSAGLAPELGLSGGRLRACPSSPNCVSSEEGTDASHRVEPLPAGATLDETRAALRGALAAVGAELSVDEPGYLRAVARTPLFGFRDDVELRIDQAAGRVHVRSASRVGHSDLGANRARVERLRESLASSPAP